MVQTVDLYDMCVSVRVMSTALMTASAHSVGGINLHQLFQWDRRHDRNFFSVAQVCDI